MARMKALSRVRIAVASLLVAGAGAQAVEATPPAPAAAPPAAGAAASAPVAPATAGSTVRVEMPASDQPREPVVQRTVIDDGRAVIEELRVRGQLVKATVHPKDGSPSYEIIVGDGSRELSTEGRNNSRGATGKRVWQVLSF